MFVKNNLLFSTNDLTFVTNDLYFESKAAVLLYIGNYTFFITKYLVYNTERVKLHFTAAQDI